MKPLSQFYKLLNENELEEMHEKILNILNDPGMKFDKKRAQK
jgi:trimethylamine:corrinoid methyltransferase-like protein